MSEKEYDLSASSTTDVGHSKDTEAGTEPRHETEHEIAEDAIEAPGVPVTADEGVDGGMVPVEKAVTNKSANPSVNNVSAIPNGGLRAWLQVVGAFFLFFNSWGIINTFGAYQTYYETGILASSSPSDLSWIGSVQAFLLLLVGAMTGPIYDAGYFRTLLLVGSFLVTFGQMMLSLCHSYWQVFLAQAVCIGLGAGCLFVPSVAILSTYFNTRIATAMGLAASGSSLGGVIYPIIFYRLEPTIGFPWATRVIGFIILVTLVVSNTVMKVRVSPAARRKIIDLKAFTEAPYSSFVAGSFVAFMGSYAPFFYVESYSIEYGITDVSSAFYLLAIINSASVFGRIIPNFIADKTGPMNMIVPCAVLSGVSSSCLIPVRSVAPLIVICALYGFFSGALVSSPPTIFVHSSPNRGIIGTRMGMGFAIISIGLLIGTPICGVILNGSSFKYVWVFGGTLTVLGGFVIGFGRVMKAGWGIVKV